MYVPVTESRERLLAPLNSLNERRDILRTANKGGEIGPAAKTVHIAHLPIEMSIRITASFAPPCNGPL